MGDTSSKDIQPTATPAPATFRFGSESTAKFKAYCEENGLTQAQGFDHIIEILELDRAKETIPERLIEIEEFERHAKSITSAYLTSLEINANAEARIREQFQSALVSKDKLIQGLQNENEKLKASFENEKKISIQFAADAEQSRKDMLSAEKALEAAEKRVEDQNNLNHMLSEDLAEAKTRLADFAGLQEQLATAEAAKREAEQTIKNTELERDRQLAELEKKLEKQKTDAELTLQQTMAKAELSMERAVMDKEREMQTKLQATIERAATAEGRLHQTQEQLKEALERITATEELLHQAQEQLKAQQKKEQTTAREDQKVTH